MRKEFYNGELLGYQTRKFGIYEDALLDLRAIKRENKNEKLRKSFFYGIL